LEQARKALEQLNDAAKAAGAAGRGAVGKLSVGTLSSMGGGFLRDLIERYSQKHPDVTVQILEGLEADHLVAVRKRQLDLALIVNTPESMDLEVAPLWNERIFAALPDDHPLRTAKEIEWQNLRNERLLVRQSDHDPVRCDRLTKSLPEGDRARSVEKLDVSRGTLMHLVALGRGIGLTSEATIATPFPKVVFRPIAGEDALLQFCAVWSSQSDNPALRRFLSMAQTIAKEKSKRPSRASGSA